MSDTHVNEYEQRRLKKQVKLDVSKRDGLPRWVGWVVLLLVALFGGYVLYQRYSVPLIGEAVADQGRDHVSDISTVVYTSNPPTSGPHFVVWAKEGLYDRVISDGHLIHSLEHGYIVVSYDCTKLQSTNSQSASWPTIFKKAFAHEEGDDIPEDLPHDASSSGEATGSGKPLMRSGIVSGEGMSAFTPKTAPGEEVVLPSEFEGDGCKQLVGNVSVFLAKNTSKRLIVVPRVGMETPIALTAWNRVLKLSNWEEAQAKLFLDQWENKGPEKTVE